MDSAFRITGGAVLMAILAFCAAPQMALAEALSLQRLCDDKSYNAFRAYRRHPYADERWLFAYAR